MPTCSAVPRQATWQDHALELYTTSDLLPVHVQPVQQMPLTATLAMQRRLFMMTEGSGLELEQMASKVISPSLGHECHLGTVNQH